jgi:hypothetical protein
MGAGFIYLIIVGLWVAYFLPRWISSHETHAGKSVDRYQEILGVVGRTVRGNESHSLEKIENQLQVRRFTFFTLVGLFIVTLFLSLLGLLSPVLLAVPVVGTFFYILVVRRQIALQKEMKERLGSRAEVSTSIYRSRYAEIITRAQNGESFDAAEHWTPLSERYQSSGIVLLPKGAAASRESWQPTAIPTPSYLNSPRVVQTRKVIDLTVPGAWSAKKSHPNLDLEEIEAAAHAAIAPEPDEIFDQEIAEVAAAHIEQLRKAN